MAKETLTHYSNGCPKVCEWCKKTPLPENALDNAWCVHCCEECVKKTTDNKLVNLITIYDKI